GLWTLWYPNGDIAIKREYKNSFEFRTVFPKSNSKGEKQINALARNATGFYSYFPIKQEAVITTERVWRFIPEKDSTPIFFYNPLWNALVDSVREGKIQGYDPTTDEFTVKTAGATLLSFDDTTKAKIIGYKIKEDWFFDSKRKIAEKRIIGICPVVRMNGISKDSIDVCWFKFTDIRNTLNAILIDSPGYPKDVRTLDDLFFFHCFQGDIYKVSNDRNLNLKDYSNNEQLRIEIGMIETEHDLWMKYSK
ncbi:MAG TPA: hypothetical protein VFJ43_13345, partial [Bacteroidia bacterium]|nr:hypothetical protein [Bacteroidia bacterium]